MLHQYSHAELTEIMHQATKSGDAMEEMMKYPKAHLQILATEFTASLIKGETPRDNTCHWIALFAGLLNRLDKVEKELELVTRKLNGLLTPHQ